MPNSPGQDRMVLDRDSARSTSAATGISAPIDRRDMSRARENAESNSGASCRTQPGRVVQPPAVRSRNRLTASRRGMRQALSGPGVRMRITEQHDRAAGLDQQVQAAQADRRGVHQWNDRPCHQVEAAERQAKIVGTAAQEADRPLTVEALAAA